MHVSANDSRFLPIPRLSGRLSRDLPLQWTVRCDGKRFRWVRNNVTLGVRGTGAACILREKSNFSSEALAGVL